MNAVLTAIVLAGPQPGDYDPSTGKGSEWGKAAPIGLLVILLLGIATFFLLRSFTRQLKKVPATFDVAEPAPGEPGPVDAVTTAPAEDDAESARVPAAPDDGTAPRRAGAGEPPG